MLKVLTAPVYEEDFIFPTVFLGGGITNCRQWQDDVISLLKNTDATILNPRRKNFPINDPNAAQEQIEWEFKYLNECDIFTMYFCGDTDSTQPICLFELGQYVTKFNYNNKICDIVVCVENEYVRKQDVYIQLSLISKNITIVDNIDDYCEQIKKKVEDFTIRKLNEIFLINFN